MKPSEATMSVQFGRWHFGSAPPAPHYLKRVQDVLAARGADGTGSYSEGGVDILYSALHTTRESHREKQPHVTPSGSVLTWDGRLDNRATFIGAMRDTLSTDSPDVSIAGSAYERWGTGCLAMLVGDWALSVWNPRDRSLVLAKDPVGTRPLYYAVEPEQVTWSSVLDPLVRFAGKNFPLDEEYIAGWLAFFPAAQLTPYLGIESVPPSCFVRLAPGKRTVCRYWDFDPTKQIRYAGDAEYEEHFRLVFRESVRRRLHSASPVLAELSGGMDSSSIVCMADAILAQEGAETPRLDTLSYFNDSEPHWDERPYFSKVEQKRGRAGSHIDLGARDASLFEFARSEFQAAPGPGSGRSNARSERAACIRSGGYRVVLSGIGGDEVTGGVPTPVPELADLIARARLLVLAHQLKIWALAKRKPWFHLLLEAASRFLSTTFVPIPAHLQVPAWLNADFARRHRSALAGYPARLKFFGPLPSFQENLLTLGALRRQLACDSLPSGPVHERRYPFLDRDLLEFLFAVPREQLVRPGQRRSLVRRALAGIVPEEILGRRRKAYVSRAPTTAFLRERKCLEELGRGMIAGSLGIVNVPSFSDTVQKARRGQEVPIIPMMRTIELEIWLRSSQRYQQSAAPAAEACGELVGEEAQARVSLF
jgi:asparagine synthase (glutamine-hydrolysing)